MNQRNIAQMAIHQFIAYASCIGASDKSCGHGPEYLRRQGLMTALESAGLKSQWRATLSESEAHENTDQIADLCHQLHNHTMQVCLQGDRPIVLGGDHSCAIGTWSGVHEAYRETGPIGLIWVDAHMDSHTPETSMSGAIHGMPLACLLGHGDARLTRLNGPSRASLTPHNVSLIGVRSFEPDEARLLNDLGVHVYTMDTVHQRGLQSVYREALLHALDGTVGYGISIDLDAIDPTHAPGVGTPEAGGLNAEVLSQCLRETERDKLLAMEIVEYNPHYDERDKTAVLVQTLLLDALSTKELHREPTHSA